MWPNISWSWNPSWTASWSNYWWLLPCCRKAGDGDRRLKVLEITREVGISHGSVLNILHECLGLSKVCARWVPRLLTPVQKSFRVDLQCNHRQRVVPYNNWWWNVDWPVESRHQTWVDAVEARQLSSTQEVPHSTVGWKSHGHNFLGLQRRAAGGLPTTEDNNDWNLLRWSADKSVSGSEREAVGNAELRSAVANIELNKP